MQTFSDYFIILVHVLVNILLVLFLSFLAARKAEAAAKKEEGAKAAAEQRETAAKVATEKKAEAGEYFWNSNRQLISLLIHSLVSTCISKYLSQGRRGER